MSKKKATKRKRGAAVRSSELVSRLHQKAIKLQTLRSLASEQVMDAELAYEDLTRQCKEAWDEYHTARKREPANNVLCDTNRNTEYDDRHKSLDKKP